uniref:rRNA adenine N(6)-methyltransferase n=1 Tax=Cannabis sativa TaxID=3483 RepID=A0A803PFH9_CANSA
MCLISMAPCVLKKYSKGQHLLTNQRILDTIVRKSAIEPTDTVLEIGPGTGNLTVKLLEAASKVFAIEIDSRMVEILDKRALESGLQDRLTVIRKDALKAEFPLLDLVVANIPYNISSPLVAKLVFGPIQFRSATLLLQKEFARRLLAKPGDSEFNRLAVNVTLVADVEHVMDVSKREFVPCPKVDSSVVIIRPKAQVPDVNMEEWLAFTRTCFGPYAFVQYVPGEPILPNRPNEGSVKRRNEKKRIRLRLAFISSEKRKRKAEVQEAKRKKNIKKIERKMAAVAREREWAQKLAELQRLEEEKKKSTA